MKSTETILSDALAIRELGVEELEDVFPLISQLRTNISLEEYFCLIKTMKTNGYRVIGLFEHGKIVSYAGYAETVNLYYGKHIWVYDLVTDNTNRSKGYGGLLLSYIEKYAKDNSLNCIALSSGVQKEEAHNFYEKKMNYKKVSYVFKKDFV